MIIACFKTIASLSVISLLCGCATARAPLPLAPNVPLDALYGGWYIVANIPNRMENSLVGMYDVYTKRPDGDIQEDFYPYKKTFASPRKHYTVHDWVVPGTNNAEWRVQIFWPLRLPFLVLYVDPKNRYILFGENNRSLGWIYSRVPTIDNETYHALLSEFQQRGYDISKFRRVVQFPNQIGQAGFGGDAGEKKP